MYETLHAATVLQFLRFFQVEMVDVRDIACGYGYTVFAVQHTKYGQLMGTGINKDGQIGNCS